MKNRYVILTAVFLSGYSAMPAQLLGQYPQGGYTNPSSVVPGDTVTFYISDSLAKSDVYIMRGSDAIFGVPVDSFKSVQLGLQPIPDSSYSKGCGWSPSLTWVVPEGLRSGFYFAQFRTTYSTTTRASFVVREKSPGSSDSILFVLALTNYEAGNTWGGNSFYGPAGIDTHIALTERSFKDSFDRPYISTGIGQYAMEEQYLASWLAYNKYNVAYCADFDLDRFPDILSHYKLVIFCGHTEYWSLGMRRAVENYIRTGGRVAFFAGNTCWWQVRFEDNYRRVVCYKDSSLDPLDGIMDSLVTVNWSAPPVNYPEDSFTGVSFRYGGMLDYESTLTAADGYGAYAAFNTQSWIFKGTGLQDGDLFGSSTALQIGGYETDGAPFIWESGLPVSTGQDGAPSGLEILGLSPASHSHATMAFYHNQDGGAVFNAATIRWSWGLFDYLHPDSAVDRITRNVIGVLVKGLYQPDIFSWSPARVVPLTELHDSYQVSLRDTTISSGQSVRLQVSAIDPNGSPLGYTWIQDGRVLPGESEASCQVHIDSSQIFSSRVTALVYNSRDTASISWEISPNLLHTDPIDRDLLLFASFPTSLDSVSFQLQRGISQVTGGKVTNWVNVDSTGVRNVAGGDTLQFSESTPYSDSTFAYRLSVLFSDGAQKYSNTVYYPSEVLSSRRNPQVPYGFSLGTYPNPFNGSTIIAYSLNYPSQVSLDVYDILGRKVSSVRTGFQLAGSYKIMWTPRNIDGLPLASGPYICELSYAAHDPKSSGRLFAKIMFLK